ncbi:MAG: hypothetical protein MUD01_25740 [Chloroflexaceae bacterium]|jgi:hypothetical protein|nr:hypothetical protein [Chloroflexaceae bacterium]
MTAGLLDTILNQLFGALIGTVASIAVSWYFYKKADFPSKVASGMTENILQMLIMNKLGLTFENYRYIPPEEHPKNTDTPHITEFWWDTHKPKQGDTIAVLFRVQDTGFNFYPEAENSIEITDTSTMISFSARREGRAYYFTNIHFPVNSFVGQHTITFKLTDAKRKSYVQSLKFNVLPQNP